MSSAVIKTVLCTPRLHGNEIEEREGENGAQCGGANERAGRGRMAEGGDSFMMNHGESPPEQIRRGEKKKRWGRGEEEQKRYYESGRSSPHFE